jgi:hypothetical protein
MDELLVSTPRSAALRDLTTWAAITLWGVLAYAATAAALAAITYPGATWGSPSPVFLVEGLLALLANSAIGYAVGYYLRSRFAAPLVPVVLYIAQAAPDYTQHYTRSSWQNLSPMDFSYGVPSVFYTLDTSIVLARAGWMLGLAAVAAVAVILKTPRRPLPWLAMVAAVALTGASASALLRAAPGAADLVRLVPGVTEARKVAYEPVCEEGQVMEVCVHPAYKALLPRTARVVNRVAAPLKGIPGAPTRAEQLPELESSPWAWPPEGTIQPSLEMDLRSDEPEEDLEASSARYVAGLLTIDERATPQTGLGGPHEYGCIDEACKRYYAEDGGLAAQEVLREWLWRQAGYQKPVEGPDGPTGQVVPPSREVERFMELDPAERREWLVANFADLRAGKLTLDDLP